MESLDDILDAAQDHHTAGRLPQAIELYRRAMLIEPEDAACFYFMGLALYQLGQTAEAVDLVRRAIAIQPDVPEYHCDLGRMLLAVDDLPGTMAAERRALALRPDFPEAYFNLGNAFSRSSLYEEARDAYRKAIELRPDARDAISGLGLMLFHLGRIDEALACFDRVLASTPSDASAHSHRIYVLHYSPSADALTIRRELVRWDQQHGQPLLATAIPHVNSRTLDRPLRIGYVSADFRDHVVAWNMRAWLWRHDRGRFHITCYSDAARPDAVTNEMQSVVQAWRDISRLSDEQVADLIRADQIDILVDMALHTIGNRLLVFARKPAPVQVTYLGYPGSTGLKAMDYRLSDSVLDADANLAEHTEETIRLPHSYWCYQPGGATPDVAPPPVLAAGTITFGCLNIFPKVSDAAINAWRRILWSVPGSRLVLHAPPGRHRHDVLARLGQSGVTADRVEFLARRSWDQYIQTYQRIDIALDPFPYCGGITSCDALWMGVPLITLRGQTSVARSGASILHNLDMDRFITSTPKQYIATAIDLANDVNGLIGMRSNLRQRMLNSPLMNGTQFARDLESAYEKMWRRWTGLRNE